MPNDTHILEPALRELADVVADFRNARFVDVDALLERLVFQLKQEPLASFLKVTLPVVDLQTWLPESSGGLGGDSLNWPPVRAERVAMQVALCFALAKKEIKFLDFVHQFYNSGRKLSDHVRAFADKFLEPLVRDLRRLAESRPGPGILIDALNQLPPTGDSTLDDLLIVACAKFRDPSPQALAHAVEKLWDAFERLKTLEVQGNKKLSADRLLDLAASTAEFRSLLANEAKALTDIGNNFHIRHFETGKVEIQRSGEMEYLFHRLFALLRLLLVARQPAP